MRRRPFKAPLRRLGRAAQNALELLRFGRLTAPYGAPFDVAHEEASYTLRHYPGPLADERGPSLILVPPLMVTSEVYDIAPEISAVALLLAAGVDLWLVDYGAPERQAGGMRRTLDDHVRAVSDAIDRVRAARGGRAVHLAGYSQGGMLICQAAALRRGDGVASLVTFGSPMDVHRNVPEVFEGVAARGLDLVRAILALPLAHMSGVPGFLSATGFRLLSARKELKQLVEFLSKLHDRQALERREAKRLFMRGRGFVAWPGPALVKFIDELIVENRMRTGGLVIDGRAVTLADIACPILFFVGLRDEIARPQAVLAIREVAPNAEHHQVNLKAGHFGLVVGATAMSITWPTVVEWLAWREGRGDKPKVLETQAPAPAGLSDDDDNLLEEMKFDLELGADIVGKAVHDLGAGVAAELGRLVDAVNHLRVQVPLFERLRSLTPAMRISPGLELATQAARRPDGTFFLWQGRAFSYRDADARVNNVVKGLIECGARPGHKVGVLMTGRPSYLTLLGALSRLGAVAVLFDPGTSEDALAAALREVALDAIVCDPERAALSRRGFAGLVLVLGAGGDRDALPRDVVDMETINPDAIALPPWYTPNPGRARDLAMIIFSGRSGRPRPSLVTNHRWAFSALGAAASCTLTRKDTVYCCLPLHHAAGTMVSAGSALTAGARLALADGFSPDTLWSEVRRYGATVVFYAGEMCRALVDAPHARGETNHPVRLFAGSGMRLELAQRLIERFGQVDVMELYGSTEAAAVLANVSRDKLGALGRPLPGSTALVLARYDAETGALVRGPDGLVARAAVGEEGMLLAALDHAGGLAADRLVEGAFARGDLWYAAGDLMRVDADGDFWFVERAQDIIRTGGGAVYPRRIEDALAGFGLAVAFGVAQGARQAPVAVIVPRPDRALSAAALTEALARLPPHARPERVAVVTRVPMTDGFRPLRGALAAAGLPASAPHFILSGDGVYR